MRRVQVRRRRWRSGCAGADVRALFSSPRQRTQETAAPIAATLGLPVQTVAALDEIDFGTFTGRNFADLDGDPDWHRWNAERGSVRCPEGETMVEASIARGTF